jgi:hypothetical protein
MEWSEIRKETKTHLRDCKWQLVYVTLVLAQLKVGLPRFPNPECIQKMETDIRKFRKIAKRLKKEIAALEKQKELEAVFAMSYGLDYGTSENGD